MSATRSAKSVLNALDEAYALIKKAQRGTMLGNGARVEKLPEALSAIQCQISDTIKLLSGADRADKDLEKALK